MKYFVAVLCLAQLVLSAPSEKTLVEQTQESIADAQAKATAAVTDLNQKILAATGVKNNQELLNSIQEQTKNYATQVKGYADQISQTIATQKTAIDAQGAALAKQVSDTAANLLGDQDPAKVNQYKTSFDNILAQTNTLRSHFEEQGAVAGSALLDLFSKLYEQTSASAKSVATQIDESAAKPQP